jgi:hypothetical protein
MLRSDAARISARAELALLGDPGGACLVVQRRRCELWYRVAAYCRSHVAGRRWIEAHYEEVRWRSPVACTALVGKIRTSPH